MREQPALFLGERDGEPVTRCRQIAVLDRCTRALHRALHRSGQTRYGLEPVEGAVVAGRELLLRGGERGRRLLLAGLALLCSQLLLLAPRLLLRELLPERRDLLVQLLELPRLRACVRSRQLLLERGHPLAQAAHFVELRASVGIGDTVGWTSVGSARVRVGAQPPRRISEVDGPSIGSRRREPERRVGRGHGWSGPARVRRRARSGAACGVGAASPIGDACIRLGLATGRGRSRSTVALELEHGDRRAQPREARRDSLDHMRQWYLTWPV